MSEPIRNRDGVLTALAEACMAHPSQRVMQVVANVFGRDPFYVEDEDAIKALRDYAALGRRTVNRPRSTTVRDAQSPPSGSSASA